MYISNIYIPVTYQMGINMQYYTVITSYIPAGYIDFYKL